MSGCNFYIVETMYFDDPQKKQTISKLPKIEFSVPWCKHKNYPSKKTEKGSSPSCKGEFAKDNRCPLLSNKNLTSK